MNEAPDEMSKEIPEEAHNEAHLNVVPRLCLAKTMDAGPDA